MNTNSQDSNIGLVDVRAASPLRSHVLYGDAEMRALELAWDDLYARAPDASVHLSRAWLGPFLDTGRYRGTLTAVTIWHGNKLVALLPLAIRRLGGVRMAVPLGTGLQSYLGVLVDPESNDAVDCIAECCLRSNLFDMLVLHDTSTSDTHTQQFVTCLARSGALVRRDDRGTCHRIRFAGSYEDFVEAQFSKKSARNLRQEERKIRTNANAEIECYIAPQITDEVLSRIAAIQVRSRLKERGGAVLGRPFYRKLVTSLARANMARVWIATVAGADAAFAVGLTPHRQHHCIYTAFDQEYERMFVGKLLLIEVVRDAATRGVTMLDFGHGNQEYKQSWANDSHQVQRIFIGTGARGRLVAGFFGGIWALIRIPWIRNTIRGVRRALWMHPGARWK